MDKRTFSVTGEWSPFGGKNEYGDLATTDLIGGASQVANRIETLATLMGVASTSHDFELDELDIESVGLMIRELAQMTFYMVEEIRERILIPEEDGEEPALLKEQGG